MMSSKREVDPPEMETQFTQAVIANEDGSKGECSFNNPLYDECESVTWPGVPIKLNSIQFNLIQFVSIQLNSI